MPPVPEPSVLGDIPNDIGTIYFSCDLRPMPKNLYRDGCQDVITLPNTYNHPIRPHHRRQNRLSARLRVIHPFFSASVPATVIGVVAAHTMDQQIKLAKLAATHRRARVLKGLASSYIAFSYFDSFTLNLIQHLDRLLAVTPLFAFSSPNRSANARDGL